MAGETNQFFEPSVTAQGGKPAWNVFWLSVRQDAHFGFRTLRKNLGFTVVALLILTLTIGANTAIFSIVNAVLLHPLPYRDSTQLVTLTIGDSARGISGVSF